MGEVYFYHLTRDRVEGTLPTLLSKSRQAGWRIVIRSPDAERLKYLDEKLWLGAEDGFVPHGVSGGPHDADQPILLTQGASWPNAPECLFALDGVEVTKEQVEAVSRVMILFENDQNDVVQQARVQWKALTQAGCKAKYWSQESGRWEMKAQSG